MPNIGLDIRNSWSVPGCCLVLKYVAPLLWAGRTLPILNRLRWGVAPCIRWTVCFPAMCCISTTAHEEPSSSLKISVVPDGEGNSWDDEDNGTLDSGFQVAVCFVWRLVVCLDCVASTDDLFWGLSVETMVPHTVQGYLEVIICLDFGNWNKKWPLFCWQQCLLLYFTLPPIQSRGAR